MREVGSGKSERDGKWKQVILGRTSIRIQERKAVGSWKPKILDNEVEDEQIPANLYSFHGLSTKGESSSLK